VDKTHESLLRWDPGRRKMAEIVSLPSCGQRHV
jgi:hypothetical protein